MDVFMDAVKILPEWAFLSIEAEVPRKCNPLPGEQEEGAKVSCATNSVFLVLVGLFSQ
jgi:hypothetical protein